MANPEVFGPAPTGPVVVGPAPAWEEPGLPYWREGNAVVIPKAYARLPARCVVCNDRAHGTMIAKKFYWHHPAIYLVLLAGILIYAIAAAIIRKEATVEFGLCKRHRTRRLVGLVVAWVGFIACFFGMFTLLDPAHAEYIYLPIIGMAVFPIVGGGILARVASPKRIDNFYVRLKVGEPFLKTLPHAPPRWLFEQGHPPP